MQDINLEALYEAHPLIRAMSEAKEIDWINPSKLPAEEIVKKLPIDEAMVDEAEARLIRFAPLIMHYFPETKANKGIIESELVEIPAMKDSLSKEFNLDIKGRVYLKQDSHLPVSGSIKARGGIYEVLKHTEDLALEAGILSSYEDDYLKLCSDSAREFFSKKKIQVGSTGNLGLSIGIMSAAIGYEAIIHMSMDAKQWKKDLLRQRGATVIEYEGDYAEAVRQGRAISDADKDSYFVDDENSLNLYMGYAVAAKRLKKQLDNLGINVSGNRPVFVYLPCGVGGAPGGVSAGLCLYYGEHMHSFFVEPVKAACMLLSLESGLYDEISMQDIGIDGKTEADGLAVSRSSRLVSMAATHYLSGEFTLDDSRLNTYLRLLHNSEKIFIEPSACAAFHGLLRLFLSEEGKTYVSERYSKEDMNSAIHILWATGGSMVPEDIRNELLNQ